MPGCQSEFVEKLLPHAIIMQLDPVLAEQPLLEAVPRIARCKREFLTLPSVLVGLCLVVLLSPVPYICSRDSQHLVVRKPAMTMTWQHMHLGKDLQFLQPARVWRSIQPWRASQFTQPLTTSTGRKICQSFDCFQVQPVRARQSLQSAAASVNAAGVALNPETGSIYRVMSANQELSVIAIEGTRVVADAAARHKTAPTATAALGRGILSAGLLGAFKGDNETVQLSFRGDGPLGPLMAVSDNTGMVKGMVYNPTADPPLRTDGKLNVGAAVGKGVLTVSRTKPDWRRQYLTEDKSALESYSGSVDIISGEIAEDITYYLAESEQVNAAIAVGVSLNRDLNIRSAGGYMVQVLPFASEETITTLEKTIPTLPSTTDMIANGMTAKQMAEAVLGELGSLDEVATTGELRYGPCDEADLRNRMLRGLASMGPKEVKEIIEEQGKVEMTCEFCKDKIVFKEDELMAYLNQNDNLPAEGKGE